MSQASATDSGSTSSDGSAIRPSRYNGKTSFSAWKLKTLAYLQSLGLKDVVVRNPQLLQVEPEKEEVDVDEDDHHVTIKKNNKGPAVVDPGVKLKAVLMKKSEKAYSILLNLLEDELTDLVATVEQGDAFQVWSVLLETYESKSTASLCHRLDLLMNIQFKPEVETFDVFKARFMKLLKELKDMDECVSPSIQRYVLLRSLPPKFEALVQSLKINDAITTEEVYIHIKDYCEASRRVGAGLRERDVLRSPNESAYISREKRKQYKCFCCGSMKHLVRECPKRVHDSESDCEGEPGGETGAGSSRHDQKMLKRNRVIMKRKRRQGNSSDSEQYSA
jgi:gag-polypeptide of LTR copia-type